MTQAHRDYSGTPLPKKLGIREGARVHVAPVFVTEERGGCVRASRKLAAGLDPAGRLWVAWPKTTAPLASDLDFDTVQRIGLDTGLVDNKSASITEEFQGLQFVYRLKDRPR